MMQRGEKKNNNAVSIKDTHYLIHIHVICVNDRFIHFHVAGMMKWLFT